MQAASFGCSNKGRKILIGKHNHEYRRKKTTGGNSYWEWRHSKMKNCKATAVTALLGEEEHLKNEHGEHTQ